MIGITGIGGYVPERLVDAAEVGKAFGVTAEFLEQKTGFLRLARKGEGESVADMCCKAFEALAENCGLPVDEIDFICVCTQNPDVALPQVSAVLQDRLGLNASCASFDISMGCSGYVYSLTSAVAFMERFGLRHGVVFTCDPYSPHLDVADKNTRLLFGDGATATYLSPDPVYTVGNAAFSTIGSKADALVRSHEGTIFMNGREIFNFSMRNVPATIKECLARNGLDKDDVGLFIMHQASRFVIDNLAKTFSVDAERMPFLAAGYGNTVSSSIPMCLKDYLADGPEAVLLCGFGVGLSVAAVLVERVPAGAS